MADDKAPGEVCRQSGGAIGRLRCYGVPMRGLRGGLHNGCREPLFAIHRIALFQGLGRSLDRDKVSEIAIKVPYIAIGVRRESEGAGAGRFSPSQLFAAGPYRDLGDFYRDPGAGLSR